MQNLVVEDLPFIRSISQGGNDSPFLYWSMAADMTAPIVDQWIELGHGLDVDGWLLSHIKNNIWWADNLFVFTDSQAKLKSMLVDIIEALHKRHLTSRWKPESLCFLDPSCTGIDSFTFTVH